MPQLGFQNRLGLNIGQLEARHQHWLGLFLDAQNTDHLIQIQVSDQQAIENMQALFNLVQAEFQPPPHGHHPVAQPFFKDLLEILDLGPAIQTDHVEIDPANLLQIGRGKQVIHQ